MEEKANPRLKKTIHLGRNTQRIREMIGMKQNTLAMNTGYSQQYISKLERSKDFSDKSLDKIANGLGVATNLIRNFDEEKAVNIISNISKANVISSEMSCTPSLNPLNELRAALNENKKLYEELLKCEREKISLLEKMTSHPTRY
jgi:transcriptional regulator with XRE-family HTH domain